MKYFHSSRTLGQVSRNIHSTYPLTSLWISKKLIITNTKICCVCVWRWKQKDKNCVELCWKKRREFLVAIQMFVFTSQKYTFFFLSFHEIVSLICHSFNLSHFQGNSTEYNTISFRTTTSEWSFSFNSFFFFFCCRRWNKKTNKSPQKEKNQNKNSKEEFFRFRWWEWFEWKRRRWVKLWRRSHSTTSSKYWISETKYH